MSSHVTQNALSYKSDGQAIQAHTVRLPAIT